MDYKKLHLNVPVGVTSIIQLSFMKQFLIASFFLIIIGCSKKDVLITLEFSNQQEIDTLFYSVPLSGTVYFGFFDTLRVNETGKFELNLKITKPSFISFRDKNYSTLVKLLVEPGNNYNISLDNQKNVEITGVNEKGLMLYATLPDPLYVETELRTIANPYNDTVSLISVHEKINTLKQDDLSKFKELLDSKEITTSFYNIIKNDRDCYYASLEARFLHFKAYKPFNGGMKIDDEIFERLKTIYDQYPPNDENLLFTSFGSEYARNYIKDYQLFIQKDYNIQKLQDLRKAGIGNTYIINESKNHLTGKALEFFQARHIHYLCFEYQSHEKELIVLFEQFEKDYPNSEYSKFLKPYIDKLIVYHNNIENPLDKDITFLENYETVNTLEEAIKPLKGKKIYIDVWATWCGPCKAEFAHNEALKKILAENDIQQLYISIDVDDKDQEWKDAIKGFHLTGTHIRANKEFRNNLMVLFSKNNERPSISIPWYILIDEQGNIMEERAKRPSQLVSGDKLVE